METSRKNPVTLVGAKGVNGGKVTLEFTQVVERANQSTSLTSLLNADDDRFNQAKPRHAWITGSPAMVKELFGIDVSDLKVGEELAIDQVEPMIKGELLNIELRETTKGTDWELANLEKSAKRAGKDGDFICTEDGQHIFTRTGIAVGEPKHSFIAKTQRVSVEGDVSSAIADAIGE